MVTSSRGQRAAKPSAEEIENSEEGSGESVEASSPSTVALGPSRSGSLYGEDEDDNDDDEPLARKKPRT